jgi:hypothetical protein
LAVAWEAKQTMHHLAATRRLSGTAAIGGCGSSITGAEKEAA